MKTAVALSVAVVLLCSTGTLFTQEVSARLPATGGHQALGERAGVRLGGRVAQRCPAGIPSTSPACVLGASDLQPGQTIPLHRFAQFKILYRPRLGHVLRQKARAYCIPIHRYAA